MMVQENTAGQSNNQEVSPDIQSRIEVAQNIPLPSEISLDDVFPMDVAHTNAEMSDVAGGEKTKFTLEVLRDFMISAAQENNQSRIYELFLTMAAYMGNVSQPFMLLSDKTSVLQPSPEIKIKQFDRIIKRLGDRHVLDVIVLGARYLIDCCNTLFPNKESKTLEIHNSDRHKPGETDKVTYDLSHHLKNLQEIVTMMETAVKEVEVLKSDFSSPTQP